jgi:FkbM family methyltransferase
MKIFFDTCLADFHSEYPIVLVDVGASGGLEKNWEDAKKYLQIIGFEPDERAHQVLVKEQNKSTIYLNTALGGDNKTSPFYLNSKQQTSSMFKPNLNILKKFPDVERFEILKEIELQTDTLDNLRDINSFSRVDFIKLDTQGSELSILKGGSETLTNQIFGVEIEIEFAEIYKHQPLFADVDNFMRNLGFSLFDIQRCNWKRKSQNVNFGKKGQLIFGNALYFKELEYFSSVIRNINDIHLKKSKILNAISICLLYGYADYAEEIFFENESKFNETESKSILTQLRSTKSLGNYIPNFRGKGRLSNFFHSLGDTLSPGNSFWSKNDEILGNR